MTDILHNLKDFAHFHHPIQWFTDYYLPMSGTDKDKLNRSFQCFAFFPERVQVLICSLPRRHKFTRRNKAQRI